ncbi:bifunctional diguanylate cyclase/phosphodiesterase [Delftia tsuruhatensis]|uniref:putative bifunctional diguanylate cyclase/phosphodiesterase n=1 Tax=Delftia TaxID=80865 RepID=UPI0006423DD2|nr:GGDEF domain-containing phosphodiesterase [Delftia tsuruhatensis]KLO61132.1 diguanylate phosphodiesterase [Delftia tsuruhatensis]
MMASAWSAQAGHLIGPCEALDEELKRVAMEAAPDGIVLVDRKGRILLANPAMQAMSGYGASELLGRPLQMLLPPEAHAAHGPQLQSYFAQPARRPMGQGRDLWLLRKDGKRLSVDIALGHSPHGGGVAVAFVRDLSQLRQMEACMHYHATHDTLTGLLNRWQFGLQLEQAISQAQAQVGSGSGSGTGPASFALLLLDLDNFKAINDGYGHDVGDQVLKEVARRLQAALGTSATLARMGGDEFTAVLHPCNGPDLRRRVDALLGELCRPCAIGHYALNFGASVGVAFYPQDAGDAATLMRYADMAMYDAKQRGRASYACYASAMGEAMAEKVLLHERLKRALDRGLLSLHFQPQVQVLGGQVQGVEALLRWNDEQMGWVSPERFVPVAESTGLILALGEWVIDAACRQAGDWLRAGMPLRVAVNLSAQQLRQADLQQRLMGSLARHGVPPHLLELEVTESAAMTDPQQARELLGSLLAAGVCVVLDDFGTGYSSLAHLRDLPVSRVKIDRTFIGPMLDSPADAKIVKAVIALARTLGLQVVAEGVETAEQLRLLRILDCDAYQGWLFARAMPAEQIPALIHKPVATLLAQQEEEALEHQTADCCDGKGAMVSRDGGSAKPGA